MSIRVAKICKSGHSPTTDGYENIIIKMKSHSRWWKLSPFYLKDSYGRIMENLYQGSKCYSHLTAQQIPYSRWDPTIIWQYPEDDHVVNNILQPSYWLWREKLMSNAYAVRYPNGYNGRKDCLCSVYIKPSDPKCTDLLPLPHSKVVPDAIECLDYIASRKKIYCQVYLNLVKREPLYSQLQEKVNRGEKLQICDVDGPVYDNYYPNNEVINDSININQDNIKCFLNDPKYPFGHGFVLAIALIGKEEWLL